MSFAFRVSLCLLVFSLSLINSPLAQSQSSTSVPGSPPSSAESAVRAVVEKYFVLYAAEDLDGVMSLWSEKSPDYASLKQNLQRQFATEDFSFSDPMISRVKVESEKASLRAMTNLTAVNLKSSQKREQRIVRNFAFVREEGKWKVWLCACGRRPGGGTGESQDRSGADPVASGGERVAGGGFGAGAK